jgi:hypothetical protein
MKTIPYFFILLSLFILITSCGGSSDKPTSTITENKKETEKAVVKEIQKAPIVNIEDSIEINHKNILCIKDSAASNEGLTKKMAFIYSKKLVDVIKSNKLKITGSPIAWFKSQKTPYFFEAGIPVDKAPTKMGKGMFMKSTSSDSAFIAHFWGPNSIKAQGYDALNERVKDMKKTKSGDAYEIYNFVFDSTIISKDAYKLETMIIMPHTSTIISKDK